LLLIRTPFIIRHNGIAELLEILGSIINGFAIPLKKEHIQFLEKALIPLHKPRGVAIYHPQLSYCISQYVEKDPETIVPIITGLVRFWPWTNAAKQVLFLNELEEVLELCRAEQLAQVCFPFIITCQIFLFCSIRFKMFYFVCWVHVWDLRTSRFIFAFKISIILKNSNF
jgi:hypothetical protein